MKFKKLKGQIVVNCYDISISWKDFRKGIKYFRLGEDKRNGFTFSLVKYNKNTKNIAHTHKNGEGNYILEGTLIDEYGKYPKGSYVYYPPNSKHTPSTKSGCLILTTLYGGVKLDNSINERQISEEEQDEYQRINNILPGQILVNCFNNSLHWQNLCSGIKGFFIRNDKITNEKVALVKYGVGSKKGRDIHTSGDLVYVIDGTLIDEYGEYPKGNCVYFPQYSVHNPRSEQGCFLFAIWADNNNLFTSFYNIYKTYLTLKDIIYKKLKCFKD